MFSVVSESESQLEAVIGYGWESRKYYAEFMDDDDPETIDNLKGPCLCNDGPQGEHAQQLLALAQRVLLDDELFVARVKSHYQMFKDARLASTRHEPARVEKVGRNAPCPCESGRKYKKCCGKPGADQPEEATQIEEDHQEPSLESDHSDPETYLRLHVQLTDVQPLVWRRFLLSSDATFLDLNQAIQACGWTDSHLWAFVNEMGAPITAAEDEFSQTAGCEQDSLSPAGSIALTRILKNPGDSCTYLYDYGDGWEHGVVLEKIEHHSQEFERMLLDGSGCFPPEDCGGPPGHERLRIFRETGKDPWHDDESLREWCDGLVQEPFNLEQDRVLFGAVPVDEDPGRSATDRSLGSPTTLQTPLSSLPATPGELRVSEIDSQIMAELVQDATKALDSCGARFGLKTRLLRGSYTDVNATITFEVSVVHEDGMVMDKLACDYLARCQEYGLEPQDLGRPFLHGDAVYRIIGLRTRAKIPIICEQLKNPGPTDSDAGQRVRLSAACVRQALSETPGFGDSWQE